MTTALVVVTYNRAAMLAKCLKSVQEQTTPPDRIFVIDNGSGDETSKILARDFTAVIYKHFPENRGSEGGYREGIALAVPNHDFVWLLDDDCIADKDALSEMLKWAGQLGEKEKVGAARSARAWDKERGYPVMEIEDLFAWRGTLISSKAIKEIGLPQGDLFLYAGDIEYGLRMREAGYKLYMIFSSRIESVELSEKIEAKFGGVRAESYKQPFRIYYAYRNELWVNMKYKRTKMSLRLMLHGAKSLLLFVLTGRFRQATAVVDGLRDGCLCRLGKNPKYIP